MGPELKVERERIGEMLVSAGLVSADDLAKASRINRQTGERLVNVLLSMGALDPQQFVEFLAQPERSHEVELRDFDIAPEIVSLVPRNFALLNEVMPVRLEEGQLTLAASRHLDPAVLQALEDHTGLSVHSVVCWADDVHACVQRHYGDESANTNEARALEAPLKLTTAVALLKNIESLPVLPGTVTKVREMLFNSEVSSADVADVIIMDPTTAASVLKVANSAIYGFSHQVDSVRLAVSLLGLVETYSVVVSSAVINIFDGSRTFDYKQFWLESLGCAGLAKALSNTLRNHPSAGVFSAGLLHDIGRVALVQIAPRHYERVSPGLAGQALLTTEEQLLGMTHTEAGAQLAQHWDLPDDLTECIRFHHAPHLASEEFRRAVSLINVAEVAARAHRNSSDPNAIEFEECEESLAFLKFSEDQVRDVFASVPKPEASDSLWSPS